VRAAGGQVRVGVPARKHAQDRPRDAVASRRLSDQWSSTGRTW
jgi:hypothetical protein